MPSLALAKSRVLANVAGLTTTFFDLVREEMFGAGEAGIYMPSVHESFLRGDLYQDAAGTTPAALGQPVGLWLDRSKGLELGPELATNLTPNFRVIRGEAGYTPYDDTGLSLKKGVRYKVSLIISGNIGTAGANIRSTNTPTAGPIVPVGHNGPIDVFVIPVNDGNFRVAGESVGCDMVVESVSVKVQLGNHASQSTAASRPALQQDANGMYVLRFDGDDDWMVTPSIDFTGTDKMTVLAGVMKVSDVAAGTVLELSPIFTSNDGSLFVSSSPSLGGDRKTYGMEMKGTGAAGGTGLREFSAPHSAVLSGQFDLAGATKEARLLPRVNGQIPDIFYGGDNGGGGTFGNYPVYIGRRNGTTLPLNGDIYGLVVSGAEKTLAQIEAAEALVNRYTRAY